MSSSSSIQQRLAQLDTTSHPALLESVLMQLAKQHYQAQFSAEQVQQWCQQFQLSKVDLALACLPVAACYASPPVSNFYVGAVAIGQSGRFYFGANQEFAQDAIGQSVHAEQSAISHAWLSGEMGITDMAVNYSPCGHCRQFMNELNTALSLQVHLPTSRDNALQGYLPESFGPRDLNIEKRLFDPQQQDFGTHADPLINAAIHSASQSYAPYSQTFSGVALQVGDQILTGRYAENAAFNPSFLPLQSALNQHRLQGLQAIPVTRVVMAEKKSVLSHRAITTSLAKHYLNLTLEYISL